MDNNNFQVSLESISDGLLKGDFKFQVMGYVYVERSKKSPYDSGYKLTTACRGETNAVCEVTMVDGEMSLSINNLNIEDAQFDTHFSSRIYPHRCNISEKEEDDEDDFRILRIPFMDMCENDINARQNCHYGADLIFMNGALVTIVINIDIMDECFREYGTIIELHGKIIQ